MPEHAPGVAPETGSAAIRVVLADDSVLFREGLARVLADNGFTVVGQAGDAAALHAVVAQQEPDVVITDIRMPPTNSNDGLLAAQRIRAEHPGVGVLVLSQYVETRQAIRLPLGMLRRITSQAILPMPISLPPSPMPIVVSGGDWRAAASMRR